MYTVTPVDTMTYHAHVNMLPKDARQFIDTKVEGVGHYLVYREGTGFFGGFVTTLHGELKGVFSLVSGHGKQVVKEGIKILQRDANSGVKIFKLECIGYSLMLYYESLGFICYDTEPWDEMLAPEDWNYDVFGRPELYKMYLKN